MAYASGTMTGDADVGLEFAGIIRDAIDVHANWTIEESAVVAGTETHHVLKNAAAGNSAGIDFRAAFGYVSATPTVTFVRAMEGFDTATNIVTKPAFYNNATALDTDNSMPGNFTFDVTTTLARFALTPTASGTPRYDICTSAERVCGWVANVTTNYFFYVGLLELAPSLTAIEAPMPLCVFGHWSACLPAPTPVNTGGGALTRHPKRTAGSLLNGKCHPARQISGSTLDSGADPTIPMFPHVYPQGGITIGADAFNSKKQVAKIPIQTTPSMGGLIGYPKGLVLAREESLSVPGFGDTLSLDSETYTWMGPSNTVDPDAGSNHWGIWASQAD